MAAIFELLHKKPELALFLSLVLGQFIGRIQIKDFHFGSVVGTLIAGIIIGIPSKPEYPDLVKWSFFYLFLFGIGYGVGPQFFSSLRRDTLPLVLLAGVIAVAGVGATIVMSALLKFDLGTAVGLLSGGMTQSAALGTGLSALHGLPLDEAHKAQLAANAPLADAITYGFGDLGLILWLTVFGPWALKINFREECAKLAAKMAGTSTGSKPLVAPLQFAFRAYVVENAALVGKTIGAFEADHAATRLSVERVVRSGRQLELKPRQTFVRGDTLVVAARAEFFTEAPAVIGHEETNPDIVRVPLATVSVVVKSKRVARHSLAELLASSEIQAGGRGVFLLSIHRGSEQMPLAPDTVIEAGDVVRLVGSSANVERAVGLIGFKEYDPEKTNISLIAGCIALGVVLGFISIRMGGVPVGLGTSGSILVVGLVAGWMRARTPMFGAVPEPARRLLTDIGLIIFIAIIGLTAGPHAVDALHERGGAFFLKIFFAGMVVTMAGPIIGTYFAHWVLKMNPVLILGGITGGQTCTPGLNALRESGGSNVAVLGYPVTYAIGNVLLTVAGPVVIAVLAALGH